jgi:hypothetical protein
MATLSSDPEAIAVPGQTSGDAIIDDVLHLIREKLSRSDCLRSIGAYRGYSLRAIVELQLHDVDTTPVNVEVNAGSIAGGSAVSAVGRADSTQLERLIDLSRIVETEVPAKYITTHFVFFAIVSLIAVGVLLFPFKADERAENGSDSGGESHRTSSALLNPAGVDSRQLSVSQIVKRSSEAVVQVLLFDQAGNELSEGSGFLASDDGRIVTSFHVIAGGYSAIAKLANGSSFPITGVLSCNSDRDLALLKVEGKGFPYLTFEPTGNLEVGDHVVAIGSPLGYEGTVSDGIVSAFREDTPNKKLIQTTAPISSGNSGGPLIDMRGKVVGIVASVIDEGQNMNFAIPSDDVNSLLSVQGGELTSIANSH